MCCCIHAQIKGKAAQAEVEYEHAISAVSKAHSALQAAVQTTADSLLSNELHHLNSSRAAARMYVQCIKQVWSPTFTPHPKGPFLQTPMHLPHPNVISILLVVPVVHVVLIVGFAAGATVPCMHARKG